MQPTRRLLVPILVVAVLFTTASALAPPNFDPDIYTYVATGRVAAVHHRDPYAVPTDRFGSDPYVRYELSQYTHHPDIKLPAWMPLDIGLARTAGDDPATGLLVYRAAFAAAGLANLLLVLLIVRRLRPGRVAEAAVAWGWNPLVVLFVPSKVDTVMVLFLLGALLALTRARRQLGVLLLTLATFVKLLTAPFLVLLWLDDLRRSRWLRFAVSGGLIVCCVAALYAPYSHPLSLLRQHLALAGSEGAGGTHANGGTRTLALVVGGAAVLTLGLLHVRALPEELHLWALLAIALGAFVVLSGYPWYLLVFLAVVVVEGDDRLLAALAALSFVSFVVYERHTNSTHTHPLPHLSPVSLGTAALVAEVAASIAVLYRISELRTASD
jgi:hypothetical protein